MQTTTAPRAKVPVPRSPALELDRSVPRHWFAGNAVATHIANGVNLLFPAGERFFVRSVHHFLPRVTDPTLRAQVRGFAAQEGRHAREHERVFAVLSEQGYDVERFLRFYQRVSDRVEAIAPPTLRLAVTAACEHYTALLAEDALRLRLLDAADPTMRALLSWHAAEEIEHRAVAFDVLRSVAPSYPLRMSGLALATVLLGGFWTLGTLFLLSKEAAPATQLFGQWRTLRKGPRPPSVFLRGLRDYMRPDFHPSQSDVDRLAEDYLASVGLS
jgi:predicted metal-dependent hydrolase